MDDRAVPTDRGIAMMRRILRLGPIAVLACLSSVGCATSRQVRRPAEADSAYREEEDAIKDEDVNPEIAQGLKGFFKSSRLPGAMSSEGAEIEQHLGVR
jgi:hypothetical protein